MELLENKLCIELSEMAEARALHTGLSFEKGLSYLSKAKSTGTSGYGFTSSARDRRKVLLIWDEMNRKNQDIIKRWLQVKTACTHIGHHCNCGDPFRYFAKEPIRKMIVPDAMAEEFYIAYRLSDGRTLPRTPIDYIQKYTDAASVLNMIINAENDRKFVKSFTGTMDEFYSQVLEIISDEKIDLPGTYITLRRKIQDYKENGYAALISGKFNNKSAAKIGKTETGYDAEVEKQIEALIRKAASKHNSFDAAQIRRELNKVLEIKGWPTLSVETVRLRMRKYQHLTTAGRKGKRVHNSIIAMHSEREAPKAPLLFWTLDGWTVELAFQDERGYDNRLVMVVVLDACTKYPIGYAIGERENTDLIKQANRNALIHVRELFGSNYRPLQLQSDRYGLKAMTPFYQALSHIHTPAAVGNAKAKPIEAYFSYLNKTYCQMQPNWTGFNLSSTNRNQPNREYLDKIKKSFPDRQGVIQQIVSIMEKERRAKIQAYYQAFTQMPEDAKRPISKEDYLMIFGQQTDRTIKIFAAGLQPQIKGIEYSFTTFNPVFSSHIDIDWRIVYDETDMSQVLAVSDDGSLRFLLEQKRKIPMDIYSSKPEDHAYRAQITRFNAERREEIIQTYIEDAVLVDEVLSPLAIDAENEAALKLMFTHHGQQKERIQDAKGLKAPKPQPSTPKPANPDGDWQSRQMDYLNSKIDFNEYLD